MSIETVRFFSRPMTVTPRFCQNNQTRDQRASEETFEAQVQLLNTSHRLV